MRQSAEDRVRFLDDLDIMEVNFKDITFSAISDANTFYDRVEELCEATGRKWFFLVSYDNCQIQPEAWSTFAARGRDVNIAYSLGSVRFGAGADTRSKIGEAAEVEKFDANLVPSRDAALVRIGALRGAWQAEHDGQTAKLEKQAAQKSPYVDRVSFHDAENVMEVDLSNMTFVSSAIVNDVYDELERQAAQTNRKWFFMVNYADCKIDPSAWMAFAHRGKRLNVGYSLGTVRFSPQDETGAEIKRKAESDAFDPNICASREGALERIAEMRRQMA